MTQTHKLNPEEHLSCYVLTSDDWAGSHGYSLSEKDMPSSKMVQISLFGGYDFSHIDGRLFESILEDYDEHDTDDELNRDHGIWKWFISAAGNDDMSLTRVYDECELALNDFKQLLCKDEVNFKDIDALNGKVSKDY